MSYNFSFRAGISKVGEIFIWSSQSESSMQSAIVYPIVGNEKVVDIHCHSDHAVAVTEAGRVHYFLLSEAFGSRKSHIARAASHHCVIQSLEPHNVQRVWLLPVDECNSSNCNCCIVALTDKTTLFVCPVPSNQQRWMHHVGAVLIQGLDGKYWSCFSFIGLNIT